MKAIALVTDALTAKGIEQGTVVSIDRSTGKVSLYLRNGLVSAGSYLYDLSDLKIGNSVLVSKVSGSYVILNKIPSNTLIGKGYTTDRPKDTLPPPSVRYWVGGVGGWFSASQNWSYTSGGLPGAPAPDETCDVIFDEKSITLSNQVILC